MKEEIYWVAEMAIINRELVDEKLKKIVDHVKTNEAGDRKLDKAKSRGRIDGMVSLAMACSLASEEANKSRVFPIDLEQIAVD